MRTIGEVIPGSLGRHRVRYVHRNTLHVGFETQIEERDHIWIGQAAQEIANRRLVRHRSMLLIAFVVAALRIHIFHVDLVVVDVFVSFRLALLLSTFRAVFRLTVH